MPAGIDEFPRRRGRTNVLTLGKQQKKARVMAVHVVPEFLQIIRSVLANEDGALLVGTAADGAAALGKVVKLHPDVLITCVGVDGFSDFVRRAHERVPAMRIVLVNVYDDAEAEEILRSGGVDAFVPAYKLSQNLGKTIRQLCPK
jgi:DNA-binding NarL/FixJ family response regulator